MLIKITALTENTTHRSDIAAEHGLSLYIETAGRRILFDMGQSDLFLRNAQALNIDLTLVDTAVLSHGHYDHGGGLAHFLQINDHAPIYVSRYAFESHYNGERDIGLSPALSGCERLIFTDDTHSIDDGLTLYSGNRRELIYPIDSGAMTACGKAEDFRHEQYLLIEEGDQKVLISGCSHKGVRNVAQWFAPHVFVGGFHLSALPCDTHLTAIARELAAYNTTYVTCHCTGTAQYEWMRSTLPHLTYLSTGETIEI